MKRKKPVNCETLLTVSLGTSPEAEIQMLTAIDELATYFGPRMRLDGSMVRIATWFLNRCEARETLDIASDQP